MMPLALSATALLVLGCAPAAPTQTPTPAPTPEVATPTPALATATPEPATPAPSPTPQLATPPLAEQTPETGEATVSIFDLGYDPATLEVAVGTQVTWTNDGALPHTVTFADGPTSGRLGSGASFQHSFDSVGRFDYSCAIHPTMSGTITVGN